MELWLIGGLLLVCLFSAIVAFRWFSDAGADEARLKRRLGAAVGPTPGAQSSTTAPLAARVRAISSPTTAGAMKRRRSRKKA